MKTDKYLYEIIEDYKQTASDKERNDIFKSFCSSIWSSGNKRRVYTKTIRFSVRRDLLNTDIGKVFDAWSEIEYNGYKAISRETDWRSIIRQKINNLYTGYFDREVILKQDYLNLLNTPKRLYFQWIDGMEMDSEELTVIIDDAIDSAEKLKLTYQKQKMDLSWSAYKRVIEEFLQKIFDNCRLIEDCEDKIRCRNIYDFINEDNFYISYFCKYLENEMKKWEKQYYGLKRGRNLRYKRCESCGRLIALKNRHDFSTKYCDACRTLNRRNRNHSYYIKTKPKA